MKVQLLPSSFPSRPDRGAQYLTTFVINDEIAIDAGSLGLVGSPGEQARIRHLFLSHAHMDHIASLPLFLDNIYFLAPRPVTIHAAQPVWQALRRHVFNNHLWPNLARLGRNKPFYRSHVLVSGKSHGVAGLRITPVAVNHSVPTQGFIIEDPGAAILIVGDTGPTEEIWRRANRKKNLAAVFLEVSYPNDLADLAIAARHLTPRLFDLEIRRLNRQVPVHAVHLKAHYRERIEEELTLLNHPGVALCQPGKVYDF